MNLIQQNILVKDLLLVRGTAPKDTAYRVNNLGISAKQRIHILSLPPVPNVSTTLKVELVTCHERGMPKYIAQFLSLMESSIRREYQNICTTDHLWPS